MQSAMYPDGRGGLKSRYVAGVLKFFNAAGAYVYGIDPVNAKVIIPTGSTLQMDAGSIASFTDEVLAAADIALADGKVLIGDAGGAAAAKTLSGDITTTREGVTSIGALKVTAAMLAAAVTSMINGLRTYLADGMLAISTLTISAIAAEKFKTTTTAIYTITGAAYSKAATDNLTFSAADTINTGAAAGTLWGIWLVQIDAAGTITTKPAAVDMTYANEAAAIAALPAVTAANCQLGYITVQALEATDWVANTDNMTVGGGAGNCTARNFYNTPGAKTLPAAL